MLKYKYETHLHTSESSLCGEVSGKEYARYYKKMGYTGIFVTDHFLNGNTNVPEDQSWPERLDWFCRGYESAAEAGREIGLDVFFAWEYSHGWAHFLTYGLDKDWLLANHDILSWDLMDYFKRVHDAGGIIIHAHPFREGVDLVHLVPMATDAVEVRNGGRPDKNNQHALDYARSFNLPQAAGSDIHKFNVPRLYGMAFPRRLRDSRDYVAAVKAGEGQIFEQQDRPNP